MLEESIIMSRIVDIVEKSTLWSSGDQWLTVIKKLSHYETETRDKTKPNMTISGSSTVVGGIKRELGGIHT